MPSSPPRPPKGKKEKKRIKYTQGLYVVQLFKIREAEQVWEFLDCFLKAI